MTSISRLGVRLSLLITSCPIQYAISLVTPAYTGPAPPQDRRVMVELVKPSDDTTSEPTEFFYVNTDRGAGESQSTRNTDLTEV